MASATESSLISRLENSDYRGIHQQFFDYLQPFSDFISLDLNVDLTNHSKKKKKNQKTTKKTKKEITDPKLIRPLAKQFLPFISRALKLLPNRLSEAAKPRGGGGEVEEDFSLELFEIYKLCLDCLSCLSPCLDCKPFSVHFQRIRLVHCMEARGRYLEAELEAFFMLESIRSVSSIKGKKVEGQYLPNLGTENADPELACLIVELVVSLLKCSFKSQRREETVYRRVLALVNQVLPWLRILDSKALERLHRVLVTDLYKCTLFILGDNVCFEGELVHMFCMTALTECLKSSMKDQFLKLAHNICSSLSSQWVSRPSLICDILQCALDSIVCKCKAGAEYNLNEFLYLVHYCVKRCRLASMDTCRDVARHLNKIASELIQVLAPIDSILRLYAAGLYSDFVSSCSKFTTPESSMAESVITFSLENGENLQHFPALLDSLSSYFHISSNENGSSPSCAEKSIRNVSCPTRGFDLECSKHGKTSLLSYLNALAFFCQPLAELVNQACKNIVAEKDSAPFSSKINYIQDAFYQFCDVFFIGFSCTSGWERERFCESHKTFLQVAIAAFTISLRTDVNVQKSVDCIDRIISRGWLQPKEMKFLIASLYNIGADLYNTKQMKRASVAFELCCRSSWSYVSLLCTKFVEKSEGITEDLSEESISGFVTDACAKSVILLEVLHQCGSADVNKSMINFLLNWSLAGNLFVSLSGPMALVRKWVKIVCKDFKDADVDAPTLYSLLSESSATLSKRMIGIILEQELLAYEEVEAQNKNLCQRMQLEIINILLLNVYITKDYSLPKSRILIRKGRTFRARGIEGLNNCIQCLSEAMSILIDMPGEDSTCTAPIFHQLALAYCLHAMCTQEAQPNLEVMLHDIRQALKLWSSINWTAAVHCELVTENAIPLLCCVADLLSLKGYLHFQYDIYNLVIILLKQRNVSLEKCLAMLWADRRLTHALCISPVNEDFIFNFAQHFGVHLNTVGFWVSCLKDSQPLLTGFRQKFWLSDSILPQVGHCQLGSLLGSDVTIDEVKEAASALSSVHAPSSTFLAGYLYYDLCERFISNGQLFEALSYAREALRLRTKLLHKKFICTFEKQPKISSETTQQHEYDRTHLEVLGSVATEVWPYATGSWNLEGCILTQWNVLQCYLESILQIGVIHEAIGNSTVAEALLLQGKNISGTEGLPIFGVAFASALGEIYRKKQLWDLAENELNSAKQILVDGSTAISCKRCKLTLEITVDQRIGDLTRGRSCSITRASLVNSFSFALDLYRSALKKLNLPEWGSSLSFSEQSKDKLKPRMTRSKYRSSRSQNIQVQGEVQSSYTKNSSGCDGLACTDTHVQRGSYVELSSSMVGFGFEEACICNKTNCWRCFLMKVMETGTMQDFICMKWEFHRRRLSLRLFMDIGKCMGILGETHETHEIFWQSISMLVNRNPFHETSSAILHSDLLEFIGKERQGDIFAIERAAILYNISWFSLKNYRAGCSRIACCVLSRIKMPMIVSWLLQAFILCRELPLLFQKVSRLLGTIFVLSTSGEPFCLPLYSGKALSEIHWAAFFHQASLGTYLNHQFLLNPAGQLKASNTTDFEGSHVADSTSTGPEACNLLRLAPEKIDNLENFVTEFFQSLPSITTVCISLLDGDYASVLRDILAFPSSFPAWMLLSRFNSNGQPIVMLLPLDLILEEALDGDDDANFGTGSVYEGKNSSKKWLCPWGYTVVDDVAPQFKLILEENYLSSSISHTDDSQGNRMLWWSWRRKLNDRLDKFLRGIEESWFGPWICLLLGELVDCKRLDSVLSELISELKCKCQFDANENLLRVILGGATSVSETEACVSQFLLHKNYFVRGECCQKKTCVFSSTTCDEVARVSGLSLQLILEAASKLEVECINREPIVLVLGSEVQMLPWENLPVLRKQEVYRMPSVGSISATLKMNCHLQQKIGRTTASFPSIDPLDAFYLLNPSGDLDCTQVEFEEWFRDQKFEGKAGSAPSTEELVLALKHHDLFIYFGHGSGTQYIPGHEIQKLKHCAATLLMGCSSGSLSLMGCYNPQGVVLSYLLAGSPAIVANLWEVTDKDIDRFGKAVLNAWLEERSTSSIGCAPRNLIMEEFGSMKIGSNKGNAKRKVPRRRKLEEDCHSSGGKDCCVHRPMIGSFISQARDACTLPLLIGASPVCYGVPTGIRKKKDL